jgi:glucose/arabinose dehydrogenase
MKTTTSIILFCIFNFAWSQTLNLQSFATGFTQPVEITHAGDSRLFVVEQTGRIKILNTNGSVNATPFLNISTIISSTGERGLLGLAFHPNYTTNGYFFVNYTNTAGNTVIARYSVSGNPDVASTTGTILMTIAQPYSNHNGGSIKFGPDGYLYIAMGDGGSGGDPQNRA